MENTANCYIWIQQTFWVTGLPINVTSLIQHTSISHIENIITVAVIDIMKRKLEVNKPSWSHCRNFNLLSDALHPPLKTEYWAPEATNQQIGTNCILFLNHESMTVKYNALIIWSQQLTPCQDVRDLEVHLFHYSRDRFIALSFFSTSMVSSMTSFALLMVSLSSSSSASSRFFSDLIQESITKA